MATGAQLWVEASSDAACRERGSSRQGHGRLSYMQAHASGVLVSSCARTCSAKKHTHAHTLVITYPVKFTEKKTKNDRDSITNVYKHNMKSFLSILSVK